MFIVGLLTWWYSAGWKSFGKILLQKLTISEDFFSIDILLGSLFAPFKQISADYGSGGTLQMKIQAWFDKLFSRFIGAIIRTLLIFVGTAWILIQALVDIILLAIWPFVPVLPIIGLFLAVGGYLP